jgi:chromodomain-helicase-DNA-binding protein 7
MGLGKTIQSIAFLQHLWSIEGCRGPFMVIAPLSTLEHWKRTVEEWTNLNCVLYYDHNGQAGRASIRYYEWSYTDISTKGSILQATDLHKFHVLVTSFEVFLADFQNIMLKVPFQFIVVDEAHRLKNQNAKILQCLKQLPCKRVLLLTGTPIQNNTDELWSLLNYIEPDKFSRREEFRRDFGDLASS